MFDKKEYKKKWRKDNPEKVKEISKRSYRKNRKKRLECVKEYSKNNKEKISEYMKKYSKQYRESNREKIREYNKLWNKNNPKKMKEANRRYRENNPEKVKENAKSYYSKKCYKQYLKNKRKTDLKFNLNHKVAHAIYKSLKGNKAGRRWEDIVGYTLNDLIKRLKKTMPESYGWQDYLSGKLHIDHIIPINVFNYTKPEHVDFKRCWASSNLRLLPAKENLIKHDKLERPFQLALTI